MGRATEAEIVDTGDKRDGRGRRLSTPEQRTAMVRAFRDSGLTMAAFARREGLEYATFAGWVYRCAKEAPRHLPVKFAEVRLPFAATTLEVRLPDGLVAVGTHPGELAALVRALRS